MQKMDTVNKRPRRVNNEVEANREHKARRVNGLRVNRCIGCGRWFRAKRSDTERCPECRLARRRKQDRESRKLARGEPKGKSHCPICGAYKDRHAETCFVCYGKATTGENNPNWKGGRSRQSSGYVYILGKRRNRKHRYQLEHIMVWEKANSELPQGWVIHHLNGIKDDNRLENLDATPRTGHNPRLIVQPYQERIRQLEAELSRIAPTS